MERGPTEECQDYSSVDDNLRKFRRFLFTGNESCTYYTPKVTSATYTPDHDELPVRTEIKSLQALAAGSQVQHQVVLQVIREVLQSGGYTSKDNILIALAKLSCGGRYDLERYSVTSSLFRAVKAGEAAEAARDLALEAIDDVVSLDVIKFYRYCCFALNPSYGSSKNIKGKAGRGLRRVMTRWLHRQHPYLMAHVNNRKPHSLARILMVTHVKPKPKSKDHEVMMTYLLHGYIKTKSMYEEDSEAFGILQHFANKEALKHTEDPEEAAALIKTYNLPYLSLISTRLHKDPKVWECLIGRMDPKEVYKSMRLLSARGLVQNDHDPVSKRLQTYLTELPQIMAGNIQPARLLIIYSNCRNNWKSCPVPGEAMASRRETKPTCYTVLNALLSAIPLSVENVPKLSTHLRMLVCVDARADVMAKLNVWRNPNVRPIDALGITILSLLNAGRQDQVTLVTWFGKPDKAPLSKGERNMVPLERPKSNRLESVREVLEEAVVGPVNLCQPFRWAIKKREKFDIFVILSGTLVIPDMEHFKRALGSYRRLVNNDAKLAMLAYASKNGLANRPLDLGVFECAGFDEHVPQLFIHFANGHF